MLNNNETGSWIKKFNHELTRDATFDLYNNFKPSELEDWIKNLWNKFSNIYLIECSPFKIEERKEDYELKFKIEVLEKLLKGLSFSNTNLQFTN